MGTPRVVRAAVGTAVLTALAAGCATVPQQPGAASAAPAAEAVASPTTSASSGSSTSQASPPTERTPDPSTTPTRTAAPSSAPPSAAPPRATPAPAPAPRPRPTGTARLSIPAIDVEGVRVLRYTGEADDRRGTRIQDRGDMASPRGASGGVGPGEVGNYIVTGHRTSHGAPLRDLPDVEDGDHVLVRVGRTTYDYVVIDTLWISFRSERDKARQSAPVPGRLGVEATEPMITLSTCATPEDHAAGNFWSDELGNPEHRIDKVGVLVDVREA